MSLSLEKLREGIGKTIEEFRNKLLPEAAIVCPDERDQNWLQEKLAGLERLYRESKDPPVFALGFFGRHSERQKHPNQRLTGAQGIAGRACGRLFGYDCPMSL